MPSFTLTVNGLSERTSAKTATGLLERSAELVLGAAADERVRVTCRPGEQLEGGGDGARLTKKEAQEVLGALAEAHSRDGSTQAEVAFELLQGALRRQRAHARRVCQIHERARLVWVEGLPVDMTGLIVEVFADGDWWEKGIHYVQADAAKEAVELAEEMRAVVAATRRSRVELTPEAAEEIHDALDLAHCYLEGADGLTPGDLSEALEMIAAARCGNAPISEAIAAGGPWRGLGSELEAVRQSFRETRSDTELAGYVADRIAAAGHAGSSHAAHLAFEVIRLARGCSTHGETPPTGEKS
jgi:hypothetical protein